MNVFVSGGCKNGKTMYAQKLAKHMATEKGVPLYYVATMLPKDGEDNERIKRHREERKGWGFETIEDTEDLKSIAAKYDKDGVYLFDSVTAFLENNLFDENYNINKDAPQKCKNDLLEFAKNMSNVVFVSDYIYGDGMIYDEATEFYRKALATLDKALAEVCDKVTEVAFGNITQYK